MKHSEKSKPVTVKNHTFASITEAADFFEVPLSTAARRLQAGWSPERAFNLTPPSKSKATKADKKSIKKSAETKKSKQTKKQNKTQKSGHKKTLSLSSKKRDAQPKPEPIIYEDQVKPVPTKRRGKPIEFDGVTYSSVSDLAKAYGVERYMVQNAISRNSSLEKALGIKTKTAVKKRKATTATKRKKTPVTFRGKTYDSQRALSAAYDVPHATFYQRLNRDWSIEEALGLDPRPDSAQTMGNAGPRAKPLKVGAKTYPSIREAARVHGVLPHRVNQRLMHGWTPEEALEIKPRDKTFDRTPKKLVARGKAYESMGEFARAFDLAPQNVSYHLKKGRSADNILDRMEAKGKGMKVPSSGQASSAPKSASKSVKKKDILKSLAREYNLDYETLQKRAKSEKGASSLVDSIEKNVAELVKRMNPPSTKHTRMQSKPAAPQKTVTEMHPSGFNVDGEHYKSLVAVAKAYKLPYQRLHGRLRRGMSLDDAVSM